MRKQERRKRKYRNRRGKRICEKQAKKSATNQFERYSSGAYCVSQGIGRKSKEAGGKNKMKRIIGQIICLGAYDDWQALPARDKILIPVLYFGGLAAYWWLSGVVR